MRKVLAISGIDTDVGKSVVTGCIAKGLSDQGHRVVTVKAVQTGCSGISDDIRVHRRFMGMDLLEQDRSGVTCPYLYRKPCSPHLAARIEGEAIDSQKISDVVRLLSEEYQPVLVEGAGGLFVPLTDDLLMIDYFREQGWPMVLVSGPRLGSINHTLASLEALASRGMELAAIVYNRFGSEDAEICSDSLGVIGRFCKSYGYSCPVLELGPVSPNPDLDCSKFARVCS
ncbi:MAG: dethiobiotin synthase [Planctomycetota bacterium]|nr:MAG: dethiobiotin synthase [Planctomycetota bacterium]